MVRSGGLLARPVAELGTETVAANENLGVFDDLVAIVTDLLT
jgi:hypothetical protein